MAKVLVAGGLLENGEMGKPRAQFAAALGRQLVRRGHVVLGGCRTGLDAAVAEAAAAAAGELRLEPRRFVHSWATSSTTPSHHVGELTRSQVEDWARVPKGMAFPEPVREADAVIIVGGWDGTHFAASWARLANKPLLPVATFGLAAAEIYQDEYGHFDQRYGNRLTCDEYQLLNRLLPNFDAPTIEQFATEVVELAERAIVSTGVFVVMSFAETGDLVDAYNTFLRVCETKKLKAYKIDHHIDARQRIVPSIFDAIRRSAFVIADVSEAKPNVYYEIGYARALGKTVIQTARQKTALPFDVFDVPTLFWDCQSTLEEKLSRAIDALRNTGGQ